LPKRLRTRRWWVWLPAGLVALLLLAGAVAGEMALRVPRAKVPLAAELKPGLKITAAEIQAADGLRLQAAWVRQAGSSRCVVVLHGVGDSHAGALGFARMFVEEGYSVLAPDSRGHGWSGGELVSFGVREADD
jgi:predicted acyl esterase